MSDFYHEETFEYRGKTFVARHYHDNDAGAPWENSDGHGPVSEWERRDKRAGEFILCEDRHGYKRFYDFQEAVKIARRDGWGFVPGTCKTEKLADGSFRAWCEPRTWEQRRTATDNFETIATDINAAIRGVYAKHCSTMTARQYAAGAALADFDYLRRWCNDGWHYCGVSVTLAIEDDDGDMIFNEDEEYSHALWGIESDADEYLEEVARELADEILSDLEPQLEAEARNMEAERPDMYGEALA